MKQTIRKLLPSVVANSYRKVRRNIVALKNKKKSTEAVFTEVYQLNKWGGVLGEFCSGSGSTNDEVVSAYVSMVKQEAATYGFEKLTAVDLGCGDFRVGSKLIPLFAEYFGVDIVNPLIEYLRATYAGPTVHFERLDILEDSLPAGDICFIRQVFQHLSNDQILRVLPKLRQYRFVYITEHYPSDNPYIVANLDKIHGPDIRLYSNSGVYLSQPPFSVPEDRLTLLLSVRCASDPAAGDAGLIRTYRYSPGDEEGQNVGAV